MSKRNYVLIFLIAGLLLSRPFFADAKAINAKADALSISLKAQPGALADSILKMETGMEQGYRRLIAVISNIKNVPADILQALNRLSENRGLSHLFWLSVLVLAVLLMGMGIE